MKKKKHDAIVYEPKELLNPSPDVTNCCKSPWVKYSFQNSYMTQLVSSQPVSAMSRNPDHNPPTQPKEDSIGQNHHQEEIIHRLAVQLRNIGDSIEQRMVQESTHGTRHLPPMLQSLLQFSLMTVLNELQNFQQEGRAVLAHYVFVFFGGIHTLLRFLWNNHLM